MNIPNDDKITSGFHRLREEERQAAPPYRSPLETASEPRLQPGTWWRARFALAASVILIAVIIVLNPVPTDHSGDSVAQPPDDFSELESMLAHEMPTDFLLDTPWYQLADTTPDFNYIFPSYEYPEDQTHEL